MPKFFVRDEQVNGNNIIIIGEDVNHIRNVLRMKKGDQLQVCNSETGNNYLVEIQRLEKEQIQCYINKQIDTTTESNVNITLFQGIPKFDKMELIIQKATEIGVNSIVPTNMKRCIVKLKGKDMEKKISRWQKIAEIAAKQSMRDKIPIIHEIKNLQYICDISKEFDLIIIAYENEKQNSLKQTLKELEKDSKDNYKIGIIIGPEGGIDLEEIKLLKQNSNVSIVTLGKRILRTETAGLTMASNIFYQLEN